MVLMTRNDAFASYRPHTNSALVREVVQLAVMYTRGVSEEPMLMSYRSLNTLAGFTAHPFSTQCAVRGVPAPALFPRFPSAWW